MCTKNPEIEPNVGLEFINGKMSLYIISSLPHFILFYFVSLGHILCAQGFFLTEVRNHSGNSMGYRRLNPGPQCARQAPYRLGSLFSDPFPTFFFPIT